MENSDKKYCSACGKQMIRITKMSGKLANKMIYGKNEVDNFDTETGEPEIYTVDLCISLENTDQIVSENKGNHSWGIFTFLGRDK